jgi:hypothetical protein
MEDEKRKNRMEDVEQTIRNDLSSIHGWCSVEKALYLAKLVSDNKLFRCVELGVFGGRSLLPIALAARTVTDASCIYGIDPFEKGASLEGENSDANDAWWSNIDYDEMHDYATCLLGPRGKYKLNVKLLRTTSEKAVTLFEDASLHLLHQDSNHSEEVSCKEVKLWHAKVMPNGYWVFDDTDWSTTQKAQRILQEEYGYRLVHDATTWRVFRRPSI